LNVTDTLPALRCSAKELITSTAGIREFVATGSALSGYLLDVHTATAITTASRALETALLRLEQTLVTIETERLQLEVAFAALTSDDPADRPATSLIRRDAEETPVMVSAPPVSASEPQAVLLAPSVVARKAKGPRSRKNSYGGSATG
jgi:hypothetical protein